MIKIPEFEDESGDSWPTHITAVNTSNYKIRYLKKYKYCIILPNDRWKLIWDFIISILILATAIYTPYRLAYVDDDSAKWTIIELSVDVFFLFDIIFSFFSAYFDETDHLVDKRCTIIWNYLKFWFLIDFVSIVPISLILDLANPSVNNLARVARLSRMSKMINMLKLLRMPRMVKQRKRFHKYLSYIFKTTISVERLIMFLTVFFILCHVASCLWYLIAKL